MPFKAHKDSDASHAQMTLALFADEPIAPRVSQPRHRPVLFAFDKALDEAFNESDHPRAANGEFGSGGGGSAKHNPAALAKEFASKAAKSSDPHEKNALKFMKSAAEIDGMISPEARKTNAFSYVKSGSEVTAAGRAKIGDNGTAEITALGSTAKGAGKEALQDLIWQLKTRGVKEIHLSAETGSAGFYEKMGFQKREGDDYVMALDGQMALDRAPDNRFYDADGHLHIRKTPISKANVCPYMGKEIPDFEALGLDAEKVYQLYRDPEELAKAAPTFNNKPLLSDHIPITLDEPNRDKWAGSLGSEAVFEAPYLYNSLAVWDKPSIKDVESEAKRELSAGYRYTADMTPGEVDGVKYDGVMREICANHVSLVFQGRAGSDVLAADSSLLDKQWEAIATAISEIAA